jgi:hypothetical protein
MEFSPSRDACSSSSSYNNPRPYGIQIYKSSWLDRTLSQLNAAHFLGKYFFNIPINIILSITSKSPKRSLFPFCFFFRLKLCTTVHFRLSYAYLMSYPSHLLWFDHAK